MRLGRSAPLVANALSYLRLFRSEAAFQHERNQETGGQSADRLTVATMRLELRQLLAKQLIDLFRDRHEQAVFFAEAAVRVTFEGQPVEASIDRELSV